MPGLPVPETGEFFPKGESFRRMRLPACFVFVGLRGFTDREAGKGNPGGFCGRREPRLRSSEELNRTLFSNGDGG